LTLLPLFIIFASLEQWPGGTLSFAYSVELYPTSLRGVGQGLATSVSRIGAILGVTLFPLIQKQGLVYGTLFFVSFIIVALVVSYFLAPETKNYTLEEISSKVAR
jgi:putative MFS transporter